MKLYNNITKNWEFYLFTLGIFLLANSQVFNFFFRFGPLIVWKQLLCAVLHLIVLKHFFLGHSSMRSCRPLVLYYFISMSAVTCLGIFSVLNGLGLMRVAYGAIFIIGFIPYVFYPSSTSRDFSSSEISPNLPTFTYIIILPKF